MKVQNKVQKNKGFTLIELVVVVAIIGVLAAVVTPRIRTALMKAKDAKAIATLDALRTATNVYYAEKGKIPFDVVNGVAAPTDDIQKLKVGHLALLVKNGYLDLQSGQKLAPSLTQLMVDANPVAIGADVPRLLVGVVQDGTTGGATANCAVVNGVPEPTSTAVNSPGYVEFQWSEDGVGLHVAPFADTAAATTAMTNGANTSCELWSSR